MNKIQNVINSILATAVVVLFVLFFVNKNVSKTPKAEVTEVSEGNMPLAYLNVDSLLANYTFAQEAQERLMSKQEDARLKLNTKARTLQNEMQDFQRKLDNNAFLSQERAQSEYQRIQKKQQDLEELEAKLTQDILTEQQALNLQLADSLNAFLADFNADGRFHVIMSNAAKDNILMADPAYDITTTVVNGMNARYVK